MDEKLMNSLNENKKTKKTFGKRSERRARMLNEDIVLKEEKKEISQQEEVFAPAETETSPVVVSLEESQEEISQPVEEIVEESQDDSFTPMDAEETSNVESSEKEDLAFTGPILFADSEDEIPSKAPDKLETTGPILFVDEYAKPVIEKESMIETISTPSLEETIDVPILLIDDEEEKPHTLFDKEESFTGIKKENPIIKENNFQLEVISSPEEMEGFKEEKTQEEVEYVYKEDFDFKEEDLFYEKKGFLMTQYEKIESYLEQKSLDGYHFVRKVGKKYFFIQDDREHYYYSINYFSQEPSEEQWAEWEKLGWQVVSHSPSKYKKEVGWFYFRHKENENEYHKIIDNEEEKYNFFRKYANSVRSTMFLLFICMIVCIVAAYLQWMMQAMLISLLICGLIFVIAFILFFVYLKMLLTNRSIAKKLRIQLRLKARRENFHGDEYDTETDSQLDTDWNELEEGKK